VLQAITGASQPQKTENWSLWWSAAPFSGATGWGKARGARKRSATAPGVEGPDGPVKKRNITIGVPSGNLRYPLEI